MKKKIVTITLCLILGVSVLAGCGKSDEEKARDEIMSNMDADEKANIEADQKAIADYEAEKQAEAEAMANEKPINYAEVLEEKSINEISFLCGDTPTYELNILVPSDEYSYDGHKPESGQYSFGQNQKDLGIIVDYCDMNTNGLELIGSYNNYNIYKNQLSSKVISIVIDDNTSRLVSVGISVFGDDYLDVLDEIYEKNLDYIVEQLEAL